MAHDLLGHTAERQVLESRPAMRGGQYQVGLFRPGQVQDLRHRSSFTRDELGVDAGKLLLFQLVESSLGDVWRRERRVANGGVGGRAGNGVRNRLDDIHERETGTVRVGQGPDQRENRFCVLGKVERHEDSRVGTSPLIVLPLAVDQNRFCRQADQLLGVATEEEVSDSRAPVRRDNDQVDIFSPREGGQGLLWKAVIDEVGLNGSLPEGRMPRLRFELAL